MAYKIDSTSYNGYRCSCCTSSGTDEKWIDTLEEALDKLPKSFPVESEYGGEIEVEITDGATGKVVASSIVDWPPVYSRGTGYTYTRWRLNLPDAETQEQIITGRRDLAPESEEAPPPLNLVTDKTWAQILAELEQKAKARAIEKAEAELARLLR